MARYKITPFILKMFSGHLVEKTSNISTWYLDQNNFKTGIEPSGYIDIWGDPISTNEKMIETICFDKRGNLVITRPNSNKIQLLSPEFKSGIDWINYDTEIILDIAYDEERDIFFILELTKKRIYQVDGTIISNANLELDKLNFSNIGKCDLSLHSRLAIRNIKSKLLPFIYFTSPTNPFIYEVDLNENPDVPKGIDINWSEINQFPKIKKSINPLCIACDNHSDSLLIGDDYNNAIFEYNYSNGMIYLICGRGIPGQSDDNILSLEAQINNPFCIVPFYYLDYIDKGLLSNKSIELLKDSKRCIYFTDTGNNKVKKIFNFKGREMLFTLIGKGDNIEFNKYLINITDLSKRSLAMPIRIALSPEGAMAILQRNTSHIIVLKPIFTKRSSYIKSVVDINS